MPKVGGKEFSYDAKGMAAAQAEAAKTGKKVKTKKKRYRRPATSKLGQLAQRAY
tara:strand:- start:77 stop:238 length:162 start_codon:yes stop_codon:yes gene_type:complete